ncbi:MAG: DUF2231 domain-containing protein [Anaerolineae bacterium]|uniref:DUF2231 domain-containing protein n=1 Tax=Candidatus Amarolinea dominans TaxID=3140696 RepID=UPI001DC5CAD7|nr:DUF2231 domain-containing protein [Anaerolineae bacterium]MBK7199704.1 DUF2231 domain-containing protein [Anaerolineae bacterium]MBK9232134.1 DUF2231 domain-containing protein [Anaerolineae bacterium]
MNFALPLHPRLVHFPVALLVLGVALHLLHGWRPQGWQGMRWERLSLACLLLGWLTILPAVVSGLADQNAIALDAPARALSNSHISAVFVTAVAFAAAIYLRLRPRSPWEQAPTRWVLLALLLIGLAALVIAGELGGRLVYEFGVGATGG